MRDFETGDATIADRNEMIPAVVLPRVVWGVVGGLASVVGVLGTGFLLWLASTNVEHATELAGVKVELKNIGITLERLVAQRDSNAQAIDELRRDVRELRAVVESRGRP